MSSKAFPGVGLVSRTIVAALGQGDAVLFAVPRYCLGGEIVDLAAFKYAQAANAVLVPVRIVVKDNACGLDYAAMWRVISTHLPRPPKGDEPSDSVAFENKWKLYLRRAQQPTVVIVDSSRTLTVVEKCRLLQLFHHLKRSQHLGGGEPLLFVALDDFSISSLEGVSIDVESALEGMKRDSKVTFTLDELTILLGATDLGAEGARSTANQFLRYTGGHIGLVSEVWTDLDREGWTIGNSYWEQRLPRMFAKSSVLEGIRRDLKEDPIGLSQTALEFIRPRYTNEYESRRFQLLRRLGIVYGHSKSEFVLCEGAIRNVLQATLRESSQKRLGTVLGAEGHTTFEQGPLVVSDDDIVVIHLSDLHVGKDYAHLLKAPGRIFNAGKASLPQLIVADLEMQHLLGRVNGVIISGDITCTGSHEEFLRAREVVSELIELIGVQPESVIIVAGNHDVQWNPAEYYASQEGETSREAFETFLELMGKKGSGNFSLTSLVSPNGHYELKIVAMDSNYVEGPEAAGVGFVSREILCGASKAVMENTAESGKHVYRWAVVHHHVLPVGSVAVEDARNRSVSVMANAAEILESCKSCGIEAILHGHEHQPGLTLARRWTADSIDRKFWPIAVIGAGSCGAKRERLGPVSHNHYYILIRRPIDILVRSRLMGFEGIGFIAHNDLSITLGATAVV